MAGCRPETGPVGLTVEPLPVQQARAYPETVTGRFVSLADFEPAETGGTPRPQAQLELFRLAGRDGAIRYVAMPTRTGSGALAGSLNPGAWLRFNPEFRDWRAYTLLSLAVHSPTDRDDLRIALSAGGARWVGPPLLTRAGWSTVLVDLARLDEEGLDLRRVEAVELSFSAAERPVAFGLDDLMLVDNTRRIPGTPVGMGLVRRGLEYSLALPGWPEPITFGQDDQGLWRTAPLAPQLRLHRPGEPVATEGEDLRALGERRIGAIELLEVSPVRVRLRNTWFFPPQAGAWLDPEVRQVRWDHTFYPDGRWVMQVLLSNVGGEPVEAITLTLPQPAGWSDGHIGPTMTAPLEGPVGAWSLLLTPATDAGSAQRANFAQPPAVGIRLGRAVRAAGDANGDGFDESQGCYRAEAVGGNVRLELAPGAVPLVRPIVLAEGPWRDDVWAQCQGLPLRPVARTDRGAIAVVPDTLTAPALVEFTGPIGALDE